jgi:hypothetical protein
VFAEGALEGEDANCEGEGWVGLCHCGFAVNIAKVKGRGRIRSFDLGGLEWLHAVKCMTDSFLAGRVRTTEAQSR